MLKVVIVQDHPMVREAVATLLARRARFQVIGCAGTIREALLLVRDLVPDVIVADLSGERSKALGLLRGLKRQRSRAPTLLLTGSGSDDLSASEALGAGAAGYIPRDRPTREILRAIDVVLAGRRYTPAVAKRAADGQASVTRRAGT
jgi:DNA-binding NarL/FixJ family response regulator